jgi:hypothetical protein
MPTTLVFATANSAIHSDLIIVALKRVGIPISGVSVLYSDYARPDSVLYWIEGARRLALSTSRETATVSGPLGWALEQYRNSEFPSLVGGLRSLGLTEEQSRTFEASLLEDRVVLCIESADESELALIFHILHHIGAEKIVLTETASLPARHSRLTHPPGNFPKGPLSLSAA